jgi:hypothetical protein
MDSHESRILEQLFFSSLRKYSNESMSSFMQNKGRDCHTGEVETCNFQNGSNTFSTFDVSLVIIFFNF